MKCRIYLTVVFLISQLTGFSQAPSFTLSKYKTCIGSSVNATINTVSGFTNYSIFFEFKGELVGQDANNVASLSHTYTQSGIFQVLLRSTNGIGAEFPSTKPYPSTTQVIVKDPIPVKDGNLLSAYGCTAQRGRVIANDPSNFYDYFDINWGDDSPIQTVSGTNFIDHTYTTVGINTWTVTGFGRILEGPGTTTCGPILPFTTVIYPLSSLTATNFDQIIVNKQADSSGSLTLTFAPVSDMRYAIYQKTGLTGTYDPMPIDSVEFHSGTVNLSVGGLNTLSNRYCYKAVSFDACGGTKESSEICSTTINASANATGNTINWVSYPASSAFYKLQLNNTVITTTSLSLPANSTISYLDENVLCKEIYCYQVVVNFGVSFRSFSDTVCVIGEKLSPISPVTDFNTSFEDGGMKLSWDLSTFSGATYWMYKSNVNGSDTSFLDTTTAVNKVVSDKSSKCYAVKIKEQCGESPLKVSCPIQLSGHKDNIVQNTLDWKGGYLNGDSIPMGEYTVEQFDEDGNLFKSESQGTALGFIHNPIDTVHQKVLYRVQGKLANGAIVHSDYVSIIQDLRLYVPDAFTPNNDGLNDTFYAKGLFWDQFELAVYNRWGEVVFSSSEKSKTWDGGIFAPGLYHCVAKVKDKYGNSVSWKHSLTMIR